jgi:Ca-activated chloride channel homolog
MWSIGKLVAGLLLIAAQDLYTLKIEVPVVSVDVTVSNASGSLVENLGKNDFQILEDGVPQEIRFFSPVSAPYNVFLLFDRSESTHDDWPFMQRAVTRFIDDLRPQDRIALGAFDKGYEVTVAWTSDRAKVIRALDNVIKKSKPDGTKFHAAVERTLRREFKNVAGRRAVVVLTDGKDTEYLWERGGDLKKALKAAGEQRIPVYIIGLEDPADRRVILPRTKQYLSEMRESMNQLAERSGGQLLFPKSLADVGRMYEQIARSLGTSYSLGYVPAVDAPAGRYRKVEVKTRGNALRITQSRAGYVAR